VIADPEHMGQARREVERLRARYPAEFKDGVSLGLGNKSTGLREPGDYPRGFQIWTLERRNAWFAGFSFGFWHGEDASR
jgi:hypothetical protein